MPRLLTALLMLLGAGTAMASIPINATHTVKNPGTPYVNPSPPSRATGDTVADPFLLPGVPSTVTGTTTGFTNDYDEICPYSGSTAPDVVYSYTPAAAISVDIDLCYSSYDTKIYVYDSAITQGSPLACNDDYHFDAPCYTYSSGLDGVLLQAGHTYYIVIDGYGGENGPYQMEVTEAGALPPTGACCATTGVCTLTTQDGCVSPSVWQGVDTICVPNTCAQPTGSCCSPDGTCAVTLLVDCTDSWTLLGVCVPNPCPQLGACCTADGTCTFVLQANCTEFWTLNGVCVPNPCPVRQPLPSGAYPVNGSDAGSPPTSFATLSSAITYLNVNGASGTGEIVLELTSGYGPTEPAPVWIAPITGMGATLGLRIRPTAGYTALTEVAGTTGAPYAIRVTGDFAVTLDGQAGGTSGSRDWTIRCTGSGPSGSGESAVRLDNSLNAMADLAVKYCVLEAGAANNTSAILAVTGGGNAMSNVTLEQNLIRSLGSGATSCRGYGIDVSGVSNGTDLLIRNNVINQVASAGMTLTATFPGARVYGNEIYHTSAVTAGGLGSFFGVLFTATGMPGAALYENFVHDIQLGDSAPSVFGIFLNGSPATPVKVYNNRVALDSGFQLLRAPIYGITMYGGPFDVDYNSVYIGGWLTSWGTASSAAFRAETPTSCNVRNNVFFNARTNDQTSSGTHWGISLSGGTGGLTTVNCNDYYANGVGGVLGTTSGSSSGNRYTMGQWRSAVPLDTQSVTQDPHYLNPTATPPSLNIDPAVATQLESRGAIVSAIDNDFEGNLRYGSTGYSGGGTAPDIGADEFEGVSAVLVPLPAGMYPINGTDAGSPPTSFATISSAISYLNVHGANGIGEIDLELSSGYGSTEPAPVWISPIVGMGASLGLRIHPAPGYTAVTSVAGTSENKFAIRVTGNYAVTLDGQAGGTSGTRDWTIRCTGSGTAGTGQSAVSCDNGFNAMTNLAVRYCVLEAEAANGTSAILAVTGGNNGMSNVTLEQNLIRSLGSGATNCRGYGIAVSGVSNASNLIIANNVINQVAYGGMNLTAAFSSAHVLGNNVFHTTPVTQASATTFWGIRFSPSGLANADISDNFIHDIQLTNASTYVAGITFTSGGTGGNSVRVYNNRVALGAGIQASGAPLYGICVYSGVSGSFDIDYNSVCVGGSPASGSSRSAAFYKASNPTLNVRNNIFFNARTNHGTASGTHFGIYINSTTGFLTLNNNDYYASGTGGCLGYISGNQPTLEQWQNMVPIDQQSVTQDPHFVNPTATPPDLKIDSAIATRIESGGVIVSGVDDDFEGDLRQGSTGYNGSGSAPDIGADEFAGTPVTQTPPLAAGTYPVNGTDAGSPPTSFATIGSAITYLIENGATGTGDILLELGPGYETVTEPAPVSIPPVAGMGATLGLRIRPATGYTALTSVAGTSWNASAIRVTADYAVTLDGQAGGTSGTRDWTIRCTGSGTGGYGESAVRFDNSLNAMTNLAVRYCVLEAEAANGTSAILAVTGGGNTMSNVELEQNLVRSLGSGATDCRGYGINVSGVTNGINLVIGHNVVNQVAYGGMSLTATFPGARVHGNEVFHTAPVTQASATVFRGIRFSTSGMAGADLSDNFVHDIQVTNGSTYVAGIVLGGGNTTGNRVNVYNNRVALGPGIQAAGVPVFGICIDSGASGTFDIDYNSVWLGGISASESSNSAAFYKAADPSLNLRNNIFFNARTNQGTASGTHFGIYINSTSGFVALSNNDYYASGTGGCLGYISGNRSTLDQWRTMVPIDQQSVTQDPHFVSPAATPPDLKIDSAIATRLESGAVSVSLLDDDFEGDIRYGSTGYTGGGTAPDIGADEFAGSTSILPAGVYPVNGADSGSPPTSFATISSAISYLNVNGASGTGEIVLELSPGYGPTEPAPVWIAPIAGMGPSLGLRIRPATGFAALTEVAGTTGARYAIRVTADYAVTLDGQSGGTSGSQDWTIRCTGSGASGYGESAVRLDNSLNAMANLAVRYCILEAEAANSSSAILAVTGGANAMSNVTLDRNLIRSLGNGATNCRGYGIAVSGVSNGSGLVITNNVINQVAWGAVNLAGTFPETQVSGNEIFHTSPVTQGSVAQFEAIRFATGGMAGAIVSNNFIHDIQLTNGTVWAAGIYLLQGNPSGNRVRICNNRIDIGAGIQSTGFQIFGIIANATGTASFDIDYNSIYIGGSPASGPQNSAALGMYDASPSSYNIRNNVFFNARTNSGTATGTHWGIAINAGTSGLTTLGYNDYYASGMGGVLGTTGGGTAGNRYTIQQWRIAVPMDQQSVSQNPHYVNPTGTPPNLKIDPAIATLLESGGTVVSGIDNDFEGDVRCGSTGYGGGGTAPDIGADEFVGTPIAVPPGLAAGVYPINGADAGSPPTSFATIRSAINYLNANGATGTGEIVLELSPGYGSEESAPVSIPSIAGMGATLGLRIRPAAGYTALTSVAGTTGSRYAIRVTGNQPVTLDGRAGGTGGSQNWTIRCAANNYSESAVRLDNSLNAMGNLAVRYCILEAGAPTGTSAILAVTGGANAMSNVVLERNLIRSLGSGATNCRGYGIGVSGVTNGSGLVIADNVINQVAYGAVNLAGTFPATQVTGNEIFHTSPVTQASVAQFDGIRFATTGMAGAVLCSNFIHDIQLTNGSLWVTGVYLAQGNGGGNRVRLYNNRIALGVGIQSTAFPIFGIFANTTTSGLFDIDYNSIYIGGSPSSGSQNSAALDLYVASPSSYYIRNNVCFNARTNNGTATGTHWGIYLGTGLAGLGMLDYNDYYASGVGGCLGYISGNRYTLAEWLVNVPMDNQSVTQDPHYLNPTTTPPDLRIAPEITTLLESGGLIVSGIDNDFEGDVRYGSTGYSGGGSAPDIGADEFEGTPVDPTPPLAAGIYPINGTGAGSPPTSFATISSAIDYLIVNGATGTGEIVLELSPGYETVAEPAPIWIAPIAGMGASLGLRILPAADYTAVTSVAGTTGSRYAIRVTGDFAVTLDGQSGGASGSQDWTIRCTGSGASGYGESAVRLDNSLNAMGNLAVRYCILEAEAANATSAILAVTGGANAMSNVILERNLIRSLGSGATNCRGYGISVSGVSNGSNSNLVIADNVINQVAYGAVNLAGTFPATQVSGNEIFHTSAVTSASGAQFEGIRFSTAGMAGAVLSNNFIHDIQLTNGNVYATGIYLAQGNGNGNRVRIYNNRIDLGAGIQSTDCHVYGILANTTTGGLFDVDYNSIYIGGSPASGAQNSAAFYMYVYSPCSYNVRNNIFVNARTNGGTATGTHWGIALATGTADLNTLSHNDYYASGVGGIMGMYLLGNFSLMYQWMAGVPMDDHSLRCDPQYRDPLSSPPDLSIDESVISPLESNAIPLPWVACDFQGEIRQGVEGYAGTGNAPDIGADEFGGEPPPADVPMGLPLVTSLDQSFPNPLSGSTTIRYKLATAGAVTVRIYAVDGREVRTLVDEWKEPGSYEAVWAVEDRAGLRVAAGVYYCELRAPDFRGIRSVVVTR